MTARSRGVWGGEEEADIVRLFELLILALAVAKLRILTNASSDVTTLVLT